MPEYRVNADFLINVEVLVAAESEDKAREEARDAILSKGFELLDPVRDPQINHVECTGWECTSCTGWHDGDVVEAFWSLDQPFCDAECAHDHIQSMM